MNNILPRQHIPDEWAAQAHCPVCRAAALQVQRAAGQPDQMLCGRCGTAFRVEQGGSRLHLTHWPPALTPFLQTASAGWLTIAEVKALVQKVKTPQPVETPPAVSTTSAAESSAVRPPLPAIAASASAPESATASQANLDLTVERAKKLYALGNNFIVIEAALKNSGATAEEIQAALAAVRVVDATKRRGQQNRLRLASGVALAGIVMVLAFALVNSLGRRPASPAAVGTPGGAVTDTPIPYNPIIGLLNNILPTGVSIVNGPSPTPGLLVFSTNTPAAAATTGGPTPAQGGLPDWVLTAAPPGINVVDVPTPSVERGVGPGTSACPLTAEEAAALFGGKKDYWSYASRQNGWTLIVADDPLTITIPSNMTAGYLVMGQALYMNSVTGPATIRNVNFAAVSCE